MKNKIISLVITLMVLSFTLAKAQAPKPYTEGSVWETSFIKTKPNMGEEYLKSLAGTWIKVQEEGKKQGLVLSYKVLAGDASNPQDFDIILMIEYY